ncbi:phasin family protein [Paenibacillus xylaniclasticus]|uniref:phasin family protein n=1 Tax=Paenibacillus xylaniclasticus TaxID=588083 RepID=UPI00176B96B9|nr:MULTISPECIES: hypothetical protein [Paenibacillus]GFN30985.1 hypothetical protein PCURB6_12450 [Paenibacillus curdlanolyticus]
MKDLFSKAVSFGLGAAIATKEQAEKLVEELVNKGEVNKSESKQLVDELLRKGREVQASIDARVKEYVRSALNEANLTTKDDYNQLKQQIIDLERRVAELEAKTASGAAEAKQETEGEAVSLKKEE